MTHCTTSTIARVVLSCRCQFVARCWTLSTAFHTYMSSDCYMRESAVQFHAPCFSVLACFYLHTLSACCCCCKRCERFNGFVSVLRATGTTYRVDRDIKPQNILLKSANSDSRGFVAKCDTCLPEHVAFSPADPAFAGCWHRTHLIRKFVAAFAIVLIDLKQPLIKAPGCYAGSRILGEGLFTVSSAASHTFGQSSTTHSCCKEMRVRSARLRSCICMCRLTRMLDLNATHVSTQTFGTVSENHVCNPNTYQTAH